MGRCQDTSEFQSGTMIGNNLYNKSSCEIFFTTEEISVVTSVISVVTSVIGNIK